ncbi:MAG: hypothetical protein KAI47_27670 [Deltaproteobacteria bacterium]|nr:hypothetical protein [Deltaproteobacteria bacterium]
MTWRSTTRGVALVFSAAIGVFLLDVILLSPLVIAVASALRGVESIALRLVIGALAIDGAKIFTLLPAAFLIGRGVSLSPWTAAGLLVAFILAFHAITTLILQQGAWLWGTAVIVAIRLAFAFLLMWATAAVIARRQRGDVPKASLKTRSPAQDSPRDASFPEDAGDQ